MSKVQKVHFQVYVLDIQVDFNISRMSKFSGRLSLETSLKYFRVQNKRLRGSPRTWFACFS